MSHKAKCHLRLTCLERRDVPSTTNLFDANFYLAHNPDVAAAVRNGQMTAEFHFRHFGDAEHRAGNAEFETQNYLDDNPDVKAAVAAGQITPFRHFELAGQFEGRNPGRTSFRTDDYLRFNDDVRAEVEAHHITAFEHFHFFGQFEDRTPFAEFNRNDYLDDNPDVRDAIEHGFPSAVFHFEHFGRFEDRRRDLGTRITLTPGQATVVTGTSQNHDDKKFFSFVAPQSGTVQVVVQTSNGVFAQAEIENERSGGDVFETQPNNNVNSGSFTVTANTPYRLRVRAPGNSPAQFTVRLTLSS
ncbi:MAG: hypothetical protein ACJ8C4_20360 [Gemmataceae bacterium]